MSQYVLTCWSCWSLLYIFSHAFEQAGRDPGCIFAQGKNIDIEKIKQSKYFLSLCQQHEDTAKGEQVCGLIICLFPFFFSITSTENPICMLVVFSLVFPFFWIRYIYKNLIQVTFHCLWIKSDRFENTWSHLKCIILQGNQLNRHANVGSRTLKTPAHTSPRDFSLIKNRSLANDSSPEILPVDRFHSKHSYPKHQTVDIKDGEEERTCVNGSKTRRLYMESSGSRDENISSPLCTEEADVDASPNGFVTARAKLVPLSIFMEASWMLSYVCYHIYKPTTFWNNMF